MRQENGRVLRTRQDNIRIKTGKTPAQNQGMAHEGWRVGAGHEGSELVAGLRQLECSKAGNERSGEFVASPGTSHPPPAPDKLSRMPCELTPEKAGGPTRTRQVKGEAP